MTCDEIVRALAEFRAIGATTAKAAADKSTATSTPDATYRKERVRAVLGSLVDPPGLDEWLNRERADLLARGRTLVQQVDAAWGAPLGEFERSLELFTAHHAERCQQYRAYLQKHSRGFLEGPGAADCKEEG